VSNPKTLQRRLMVVGFAMLLLSPFLVIFMLVYLFLRHAEQFYNHPSTASSRRWSNLSRWIFREFNEVFLFLISILFSALLLLSWCWKGPQTLRCYMKENNSLKCLSYFMEAFERLWVMYLVTENDFIMEENNYKKILIGR